MTVDDWKKLARRILLMLVDALERDLGISPTTCEIRARWKTGSSL